MKDLFGQVIYDELKDKRILEVRLKSGFPLLYYTDAGRVKSGLIVTDEMMEEFLSRATEGSIYTVGDKMKEGYISYRGVRIGLAGEYVSDGYSPTVIKKITSAVVRIPRQVIDCSLPHFDI